METLEKLKMDVSGVQHAAEVRRGEILAADEEAKRSQTLSALIERRDSLRKVHQRSKTKQESSPQPSSPSHPFSTKKTPFTLDPSLQWKENMSHRRIQASNKLEIFLSGPYLPCMGWFFWGEGGGLSVPRLWTAYIRCLGSRREKRRCKASYRSTTSSPTGLVDIILRWRQNPVGVSYLTPSPPHCPSERNSSRNPRSTKDKKKEERTSKGKKRKTNPLRKRKKIQVQTVRSKLVLPFLNLRYISFPNFLACFSSDPESCSGNETDYFTFLFCCSSFAASSRHICCTVASSKVLFKYLALIEHSTWISIFVVPPLSIRHVCNYEDSKGSGANRDPKAKGKRWEETTCQGRQRKGT